MLFPELLPRLTLDDPRAQLPLCTSELQVSDNYLVTVESQPMLSLIDNYIASSKQKVADACRDGLMRTLDKESKEGKMKAERKAEKKNRQKQRKAGKSSILTPSIWVSFLRHKLIFFRRIAGSSNVLFHTGGY